MCVHVECGVFGLGSRVYGASTFRGLQSEGCVFRAESAGDFAETFALSTYGSITPYSVLQPFVFASVL